MKIIPLLLIVFVTASLNTSAQEKPLLLKNQKILITKAFLFYPSNYIELPERHFEGVNKKLGELAKKFEEQKVLKKVNDEMALFK